MKDRKPSSQEVDELMALFNARKFIEAEATAKSLVLRYPSDGFSWKALGLAIKQAGRPQESIQPMEKAISLSPMDANAHNNLGTALNEAGHLAEAEISLRRALEIDPNYADAYCNLGALLHDMSRPDESEHCYRRAIEINPNIAETHYNLGNVLKSTGRLEEAVNAYQKALELKPDYAAVYNNLGLTLQEMGYIDEAEKLIRIAIAIEPMGVQAHSNLGNILQDAGRFSEAEDSYRRALQLAPDLPEVYNNLGITLQEIGRLDESENCYRHALELKPDYVKAHSGLLFLLNFKANNTPVENYDEAQGYAQRIALFVHDRYTSWSSEQKSDRLRIGFVSGDFINHPVGYFIENLLKHLDQASFELIAYPTVPHVDALTVRIKSYFSAWKPFFGMDDEAAAALIHDDRIHILIDLAGHTRYNRLPVFARKPAPVQVSWLGYFATTGLKEMDYLIADAHTLPESIEQYFTEKIWRLPETRLCFTPPDMDVPVSTLPALRNGYVTFGCFNNLTKMNDKVVELWSRIMTSVPNSRLFLKTKQLNEAAIRQHTAERFAAHKIDASRLIMESTESREKYFAAYNRVDISLDPFPYPGGTTTVESLWMGVPVLTLNGESFLSRQGVGILMNSGLADWIANDAEEYVARAASYAQDLGQLSTLRLNLRQQVLASPIMDGKRFAEHFGNALRGMWQKWCVKR